MKLGLCDSLYERLGNILYDHINDDFISLSDDILNSAKWNASDWYPQTEDKIRKLLSEGKTFLALGYVQKEIQSFMIARLDDGKIKLSVKQSMDEDEALIEDALPNDFKDILSYELIDQILDSFQTYEIYSDSIATEIINTDDIETIKSKLKELANAVDEDLENTFNTVKELVLNAIEGNKEEELE